jgi:predicted permease
VAQIIGTLVSIFLLIGVGLIVRWRNILPREQTVAVFNAAVVNLTLPASAFLGLARIPSITRDLLLIPIIAVVVIVISGVLAAQIARALRLRRPTAGALVITSMCGSTGFFGTPLFQQLQKAEPAKYGGMVGMAALYSEVGTLIPLLTLVVLVANYYGEGQRWSVRHAILSLFRFLPFVALLLGFLFWPETHAGKVPQVISDMLGYMQAATVMLTMVALGMTITIRDFSQYLRSVLSVNLIKLLFAPAVALLLGHLFGLQPGASFVVVIESAIPAILLAIAYSGQYKLDVEFASTAVFATFFFSFITLPLWAYVARF